MHTLLNVTNAFPVMFRRLSNPKEFDIDRPNITLCFNLEFPVACYGDGTEKRTFPHYRRKAVKPTGYPAAFCVESSLANFLELSIKHLQFGPY